MDEFGMLWLCGRGLIERWFIFIEHTVRLLIPATIRGIVSRSN